MVHLGAGVRAETSLGGGGAADGAPVWPRGKRERDLAAGLRGRCSSSSSLGVGRGQGDPCDLQGQAAQDSGTTQEAVNGLAYFRHVSGERKFPETRVWDFPVQVAGGTGLSSGLPWRQLVPEAPPLTRGKGLPTVSRWH